MCRLHLHRTPPFPPLAAASSLCPPLLDSDATERIPFVHVHHSASSAASPLDVCWLISDFNIVKVENCSFLSDTFFLYFLLLQLCELSHLLLTVPQR